MSSLKSSKIFITSMLGTGALILTSCASPGGERRGQFQEPDGFTVEFREYLPRKDFSVDRTVIIFPPTGGANYLDKSYARAFSRKGAKAYVIQAWSGQDEESLELSLHERLHLRAVRAIEVITKNVESGHKVSLLGTSVGGLFSSIAASTVERPDRVVVIGAGIPIPEIIVNSDQQAMKELKQKRYEAFSFKSDEEYLKKLSSEFGVDPSKLPQGFKKKKLGVVVFNQDETVPTKNQQALKELWGPELLIELDSGHMWGIIKTWLFHTDEISDFLIPEKS